MTTQSINVVVPHTLGAARAIDRLSSVERSSLLALKEVEVKWTVNVGLTETMSMNICGTLRITDTEVVLESDTPLPDMIDRRIGEKIKSKLVEALK